MIDNIASSMNSANQAKLDAQLKAAQEAKAAKEDAKLREACEGFEAMFLKMMYKEMRSTVPDNELFGTSNGEKIMQDMLDTQMIDNISAGGGVGLADMMYKQLKLDEQAKSDMAKRAAEAQGIKVEKLDIQA